jgi:succinate dehydrogenase/fumarate reductase flavoprotein subunit
METMITITEAEYAALKQERTRRQKSECLWVKARKRLKERMKEEFGNCRNPSKMTEAIGAIGRQIFEWRVSAKLTEDNIMFLEEMFEDIIKSVKRHSKENQDETD